MNYLLFGDNLQWLQDRELLADASVDLIYLDPPFNSSADYSILLREESGEASEPQFHAFTDTWSWADAAETYGRFIDNCPNVQVVELMRAMHSFLKNSPMMAYLAMMGPRLVALRRILKATGSLYLHCDPTASHYLKLLLDAVFEASGFRNEIMWKRTPFAGSSKARARQYPRSHDIILFYTKGKSWTWNAPHKPYSDEYLGRFKWDDGDGKGRYRKTLLKTYSRETFNRLKEDNELIPPQRKGAKWSYKQYLSRSPGSTQIDDVWTDINAINPVAKERLGYPTQKPLALLERIIEASSEEGGVILDPFCGCGTTIHAAQKLGRQWIGIDITYLAINLIKRRLRDAFGKKAKYEEKGQPTDFASAKRLAELDKFQFQQWALSLVDARPLKENGAKGADRGLDGAIYLYAGKTERAKVLVQVKGGSVKRSDVATLVGDVQNQGAVAGVLITLENPTKSMRGEAADAGRYTLEFYHSKTFPKIQILTVDDLISGKGSLDAPPQANLFAQAEREESDVIDQEKLL
jgi:site-specific DNA-methyltransferase (adenine-specific)